MLPLVSTQTRCTICQESCDSGNKEPVLTVNGGLDHLSSAAGLRAGVTESNLHGEVDSGPAVGKEAW